MTKDEFSTSRPVGQLCSDADMRQLALSLKIKCQFGKSDCMNMPVCDCPALSTPPAENSNPSGASDGADGQGVCSIDPGLWEAVSLLRKAGEPKALFVVCRLVCVRGLPQSEYLRDFSGGIQRFVSLDAAQSAIVGAYA